MSGMFTFPNMLIQQYFTNMNVFERVKIKEEEELVMIDRPLRYGNFGTLVLS